MNRFRASTTFAWPNWADVFELSPVATLLVQNARSADDDDAVPTGERMVLANRAARQQLDLPEAGPLDPAALAVHLGPGAVEAMLESGEANESTPNIEAGSYTVCIQRGCDGYTMAQLTVDGRAAMNELLSQQQRFRSALMELSELAHAAGDDDDFYQRLIERAVAVVPGAQGGSVQLNIPGTAKFRFVAAVGYDLAGLQRHVLDQEHFFRDAWDPRAHIVRQFEVEGRSPEITEWLETVGRLSEIVVNVSAPVVSDGFPVAFLSLDNFEDPGAITEVSVEMTTVLSRLIGELWRRRELEAELRTERESFRHQAMHDPLTGLANRRNLERSLADLLSRDGPEHPPRAVLFVDIDDFKGVNDRLGHEAGDQLLVGIARGLQAAVRAGDLVGRWGGDEFLVLPDRLRSPEEAMVLAGRVLRQFERELDLGNGVCHRARLTVGVGWNTEGNAVADELIRAADEALYEAKAAGKGVARLHWV